MIAEQLTIDGQVEYSTPDGLMKVTRRLMRGRPATYKSHRLLMIDIAKAWGFQWDSLDPPQRYILERLFDSSPDIERAARKVREEDTELAKAHTPTPLKVKQEIEEESDPFDDVKAEVKRLDENRRRWQR